MATLGSLVSATVAAYSAEVADNFSNHNAVLRYLKKNNVKTFSGGTSIYQAIRKSGNSNAGSYSGADTFTVAQPDPLESGQFAVAQYVAPLSIDGRTEYLNMGAAQKHDLVEEIVQSSVDSLYNVMNQHIWGDGTGNSGKDLTGFEAMINTAPGSSGVYGGLDGATQTYWKNQVYAPAGAGVTDKTNIQLQWGKLFNLCSRGSDKPKVIFAETDLYEIFVESLTAIQRITKSDTASAGFTEVEFRGVPVVREDTASGITANTAYFLNTDYLFWRPHAKRNFVNLDSVRSANADVTNDALVWMGNLTCSGRRFQGVFTADVTT